VTVEPQRWLKIIRPRNAIARCFQFFGNLALGGICGLRPSHHRGRTHPTKGVRPPGRAPFAFAVRTVHLNGKSLVQQARVADSNATQRDQVAIHWANAFHGPAVATSSLRNATEAMRGVYREEVKSEARRTELPGVRP
jgi:hypothetical protein